MSLSTRASMGSGKTIVRILIRGGFCEGGLPDRCSSVVRGRTLAGSHASEPSDGSSVLRDILTAVPSQYFIDEGLTSDAVPLIEHSRIGSVYEMRGPAGPPCGSRVPVHTELVRRKFDRFLCQNCVRYPLKPRSNTVTYGDTPMHIVVAGSR